jgi:gamma-glutamyltranspeptidase/glutathione hydrolase
LQENPASTSVAVIDAFGNAVSCVFSMNSLFGVGRVAPGTGIVLAARPGGDRGDGMSLLPVIIANDITRDVTFAGAVSGGIIAAPVLTTVLASAIQADVPLAEAVAQPRVFDPGVPDVVIVEPDLPAEIVDSLVAKGHELRTAPELGRMNAIYCPAGVKGGNNTCQFVNDPRGFGLAVGG